MSIYGHSHALQGVEFTHPHRACSRSSAATAWARPRCARPSWAWCAPRAASIRFGQSDELTRLNPAQIARLGIGYVPQGRRLWRSLTVDEHLRVIAERTQGRLDDRAHLRHLPAARRAQEQRRRTAFRRRAADARDLARAARQSAPAGDGRADRRPRAADRRAGRGDAGPARRGRRDGGAGDRAEHRRRLRGVRERRHHGQRPHQPRDRGAAPRRRPRAAAAPARRRPARPRRHAARARRRRRRQAARARARRPAGASTRIYVSNPTLPTRWSQPVPVARIEAAARTSAASVVSLDEAAGRRAEIRPLAASGPPVVLVAGTLDTKGEELRFIRDLLKQADVRTRLVDLSTSGKHSAADVAPLEIALHHPRGAAGVFTGDRGASVAAHGGGVRDLDHAARAASPASSRPAARARPRWSTPAMRRLPVGVPKIMISTVASGEVGRYVGAGRHHDDVFGHRRAGPQRRSRARSWRTARRRWPAWCKARLAATREARGRARATRAAGDRAHDVRRHHALRAAAHRGAEGRVRLPRVPCDRHRRPVDGEAGRRRPARGRDRHHHHRGVRPADGRRVSGDRGPLRRDHPRAHALCRLGRRARHGQFRPARDRAGALSGAACSTSTIRRSR